MVVNATPFIVVVSTLPVGCKNVSDGYIISSSVGNAESQDISAPNCFILSALNLNNKPFSVIKAFTIFNCNLQISSCAHQSKLCTSPSSLQKTFCYPSVFIPRQRYVFSFSSPATVLFCSNVCAIEAHNRFIASSMKLTVTGNGCGFLSCSLV